MKYSLTIYSDDKFKKEINKHTPRYCATKIE